MFSHIGDFVALVPKSTLKNGQEHAPSISTIYYPCYRHQIKDNYLGLYTKEFIKEGCVFAKTGGLVVSSLENVLKDKRYAVLIDKDVLLSPDDYENIRDDLVFINHSCDSNLARIGGLILVAKRNIQRDEELTLDYAPLISGRENWKMVCNCSQDICRKIITGDDWKDPEIAKKLWQEWLPFIQREILKKGIL